MFYGEENKTRVSPFLRRRGYDALLSITKTDSFSDLKTRKCTSVVETRLLRFWEARNLKRGGELMWMDMLLVDVNATRMQASISASRLPRFHSRLAAGTMFSASDIIGEITSVKSMVCDALREKNRVMATIKLDNDTVVTLSLFDSHGVPEHLQACTIDGALQKSYANATRLQI
ncbi:hypothetical protein Bca52824_018555 [Brassica carinata]|uniref:Uncharacterized protein n=1 Tax=Brassica carinata TaxID=52824 RepID=A0A8X7VQT4_BRACI|nr:hypothetical protein Bca52824_018555 [Brassica carinata]